MKKLTHNFVLFLCLSIGFGTFAQDAVKKANSSNEKKAAAKLTNENIADFLVKAFEGRMLATKESKIASKKGSSAALRSFGLTMVKEQNALYTRIKILAIKNNATLPKSIGAKELANRDNLMKYNGKDFDLNYKKLLTVDLERDIKLFKYAAKFKNEEVSHFATKYLPMLESQLSRIKALP